MNTAAIASAEGEAGVEERRRYPRHAVRIEATLHAGGKTQATVIEDLSAGGAGLNGAIGVFPEDAVEIEFRDGRRIAGTVAWWLTGCCGVQFNEPLAEADPLLDA